MPCRTVSYYKRIHLLSFADTRVKGVHQGILPMCITQCQPRTGQQLQHSGHGPQTCWLLCQEAAGTSILVPVTISALFSAETGCLPDHLHLTFQRKAKGKLHLLSLWHTRISISFLFWIKYLWVVIVNFFFFFLSGCPIAAFNYPLYFILSCPIEEISPLSGISSLCRYSQVFN